MTVRDAATEAYPILSESYVGTEDCPSSYIPWQSSETQHGEYWTNGGEYYANQQQPQEQQQQRANPCFTPIITIHDRTSNSWGAPGQQQSYNSELPEVLLISGLENSAQDFDALGSSSIYQTLRLLLECARCEYLSPWANHTKPRIDEDGNVDLSRRDPDQSMDCRQDLKLMYHKKVVGKVGSNTTYCCCAHCRCCWILREVGSTVGCA